MELRHLLAFVAVAEEGTFNRAARRLNITQPPLSRQVRQLERELGGPLFLRGRGGAALTPEGRRLLNRARPVLESFRDIQQFGRESQSKPRALQIGVGCGLWEALERIRALHATRFPGARVAAQDLCPAQQPADRPGADLIITRERPELFVFECEVLFEEQFVALISDRHRLAPRESVTLADLASEPLLLFERSCEPGTWDGTVELIRRSSPRPRIIEGQPPPCTVAAMATIASGDGYYLSTASPFTQTHQVAGIAAVPLREPRGGVKVRLAWRADAPEDVKEFAEAARIAFRVGEHRGAEDE